ncbi:C39 family peptidase [Acidocella sp.]|uniref:C39 family peptidase n=1 Tax=Acidocella sp. TaxID=50710 RepID=UPI002635D551|nr:C39 family peptidase [Acidocella sp.]
MPMAATAGQVAFTPLSTDGGAATIKVQSFEARKFATTIQQKYDFSCGSAALATLLLFTYHIPETESSVFTDMFLNGDQSAIQQAGFSLLDMKNYLTRHGIPSGGFRAPLTKVAEVRVPAIVLINERGFKHFVVLRGIRDGEVLLADPALGLRSVEAEAFNRQWTGIFFIILSDLPTARAGFNNGQDWAGQPDSPLDLGRFTLTLASLEQVNVANPNLF